MATGRKGNRQPIITMDRLTAVKLLIDRHRSTAQSYADLANYHLNTAKDLEEYQYELTKPGFHTKGSRRFTKRGRTEPYLVQAHDGTVIE